jgi:hypothetical protein
MRMSVLNRVDELLFSSPKPRYVTKQFRKVNDLSEEKNQAIYYEITSDINENILPNLSVYRISLFLFGEWWILETTNRKYKGLLQSGGKNLKEFLINLPKFHSHLMLLYPKLTPPEFSISDIQESSLNVHYFSKRDGLKDFVKGLLSGLGKLYETPISISELNASLNSNNQAILNVTWQ